MKYKSFYFYVFLAVIAGILIAFWGIEYFKLKKISAAAQSLERLGFDIQKEYSEHVELKDIPKNYKVKRVFFGKKLTAKITGLTKLAGLDHPGQWPNVCSLIGECSDLKVLLLKKVECDDSVLTIISGLPNLTHLTLSSDSLTDGFIEHVVDQNKLTYANLSISKLTASGLNKFLDKSPELNTLCISTDALDSNTVKRIKTAGKITDLTISNFMGTQQQLDLLSEITAGHKWQDLTIDGPENYDETKAKPFSISVKDVQAFMLIVRDIPELKIENCGELESVVVSNVKYATLKNCKILHSSSFYDCKNIELDGLPKMHTAEISRVANASISNAAKLERLDIAVKYKFEVHHLPQLQYLRLHKIDDLSKDDVTKQSMVIENCPKIKIVDSNVLFTDQAKVFAQLPSLLKISYSLPIDGAQTAEGAEIDMTNYIQAGALSEISKSKSLQEVQISLNKFLCEKIGPEFTELSNIRHLGLQNTESTIKKDITEFPLPLPKDLVCLEVEAYGAEGLANETRIENMEEFIAELLKKKSPNLFHESVLDIYGKNRYMFWLQGEKKEWPKIEFEETIEAGEPFGPPLPTQE